MACATTTVTVHLADLPQVQRLVRAAADVFDESIDVDRMREQHAEGSPVMLVYEIDRVTLLELYDALKELAANVEAGRPCTAVKGAWQPMETAPKDGTRVLLFARDKYYPPHTMQPLIASWSSDGGDGTPYWRWQVPGYTTRVLPTHWMPLPPDPDGSAP